MKHWILLAFIILSVQQLTAQTHWESMVVSGSLWRYFPATSEVPANWMQPGFDDSSWLLGKGGIGYADGDDATIIDPVNSLYLRINFQLDDPALVKQLLLDIDYDDAFVCYLNGEEVARSSNVSAEHPKYNTPISSDREARMYQGQLPERHRLEAGSLIQGTNTLAVHILNHAITSSDMSSLVHLNAEIAHSEILYHPVPEWFWEPPSYEESNLPILHIDTRGKSIPDEPKLMVRIKVIDHPGGGNQLYDTIYAYDAWAGIEIRGSSSQMFEKKNYGLETRDEAGNNLNVSLLGMPEENDWMLHGPYSDKSLMRNALAYHLGNGTGRWAPRTRYCELYINDDYRGIYVLTERIKRDKNRLDLATIQPEDIEGDELSGGYILKVDRPDPGAWISPYKGRTGRQNVPISYVDPEYEELLPVQREYIKKFVTDFEHALHGPNFKDPEKGYRPYVDINSFADYFIINELSRNLDAYRVSNYFHKTKDSKGGKIVMGPFWDYNLGFGNGDFYAAGYTKGWVVDGVGAADAMEITFWWDRLREDPYFEGHVKKRWNELREEVLSLEQINAFIDSSTIYLAEAKDRNFERWNILASYVWPNFYVGGSYPNEISFLKSWISNRIIWMDEQIAKFPELTSGTDAPLASIIESKAYPSPFVSEVNISFQVPKHAELQLNIYDARGKQIVSRKVQADSGLNRIRLDAGNWSKSHLYFYTLTNKGVSAGSGKMMRRIE
ncbi:CotH kinase family protein [Roseimarinus sediminis]|uniref:CotH kinase family protein n=1 Tax=Roseimarinus sediminis TaxID=1610899 RepID=UPI003D199B44